MWEKSTTDILLQTAFIGRVLLSLPMIEDDARQTMATDGKAIYWNRSFAEGISSHQRDGVRVHECLHVLMGHHVRQGTRDPVRWNIACDYEINPHVLAAGYDLPSGALIDVQFYRMSAEEIYELIPEDISLPGWGLVEPNADDGKEWNQDAAMDEWRKLVASVQWGQLPAELSRALQGTISPKKSLLDRISPLLTAYLPYDDETWLPPSRRYGLLPSVDVKPSGHIVACVDTSGSISDLDLREFASAVCGCAGVGRIDIIFGDSAVHGVIEDINSEEEIISAFAKLSGGGGTDFKPLINEAEKRQPDAILYLTDGYGDFGESCFCPVIWIMSSDVIAPWGDTIPMRIL